MIRDILADLLLDFEAFLNWNFEAFLLFDRTADLLRDSSALLVLHLLAFILGNLVADLLLNRIADFLGIRCTNFTRHFDAFGDFLADFVLHVIANLLWNRFADFLIFRAAVLLLGNQFALLARHRTTFLLCNFLAFLDVDRVADLLWLVLTLLYLRAISRRRIRIWNADLDVIAHLLVGAEFELFVDAFVTGFALPALLVWTGEQRSCVKPGRHAQKSEDDDEGAVCAHDCESIFLE